MPAKSKAQRELMAIAEHHPGEVSGKNRGILKMSHQQLHDFASTKQTGLPEHIKKHFDNHERTPYK
jgi:hypothetical protein